MNSSELLILRLLQAQPRGAFGLELVATEPTHLNRSTIYIFLGRLQEQGLVRAMRDERTGHHGVSRPRYLLTAEGKRALRDADTAEVSGFGAAEV